MSEELKKRLYDFYFAGSPIRFEQITDDQWEELGSSSIAQRIRLNMAFEALCEGVAEALKPINEAIGNMLKTFGIEDEPASKPVKRRKITRRRHD